MSFRFVGPLLAALALMACASLVHADVEAVCSPGEVFKDGPPRNCPFCNSASVITPPNNGLPPIVPDDEECEYIWTTEQIGYTVVNPTYAVTGSGPNRKTRMCYTLRYRSSPSRCFDLEQWVLGMCPGLTGTYRQATSSQSPGPLALDTDSGLYGVKWTDPNAGSYCVEFIGEVAQGPSVYTVKSGNMCAYGTITGPACPDNCPNDPNKFAPGVCGCGVSDVDSDNDHTPDCHDECPHDPAKVVQGACPCGVPNSDFDDDGTPDCHDECPEDPDKVLRGQCPCGVPDTDTDHDGTADCVDVCIYDDQKAASDGLCGCGIKDEFFPDCDPNEELARSVVAACDGTNRCSSAFATAKDARVASISWSPAGGCPDNE